MPSFRNKGACSPKFCTIVTGVVSVLALCSLIAAVRQLFVHKQIYKETKAGTCTTIHSYYRGDILKYCQCGGRNCKVKWNCLMIEVSLVKTGPPEKDVIFKKSVGGNWTNIFDSLGETVNKTKTIEKLNTDNRDRLQLYHDETLEDCTYEPECSKHRRRMAAAVAHYNATFGAPGTVFKCFYRDENPYKVVKKVTDPSRRYYTIIVATVFLIAGIGSFIYCFRSIEDLNWRFWKKRSNQDHNSGTEMQNQPMYPGQQPTGQNQYQPVPTQQPGQYPSAGQYGPPAGQYGPPAGQYGPPAGQYGPPAGQYPPPAGQYGPPAGQYGPPSGQYPPPAGQYGPPAGQYPPPAGPYGPPAGQYPPPSGPYGPPAGQYPPSDVPHYPVNPMPYKT